MPKDEKRAACMAAVTPAAFARAYGKDGKALRTVLRSKFGVYVSKGASFDDALKGALYAHLEGDTDALSQWQEAQSK